MMTRTEHLLVILMEECAEVAQEASKALRFGLDDSEPGRMRDTNAVRIVAEWLDLNATVEMLFREGALPSPTAAYRQARYAAKTRKIERFLAYSAARGTLAAPPSPGTTGEEGET